MRLNDNLIPTKPNLHIFVQEHEVIDLEDLEKVVNDVVYAIAYRARELRDLSKPQLADLAGDGDTRSARIKSCGRDTTGQMIETILCKEFLCE